MANMSYKCLTCGAELFWKADRNAFVCDYCEDSFTLEQLKEAGQTGEVDETKVQKAEELMEGEADVSTDGTVGSDLVKYTCSHCGAEIITDRSTAATICVYCGNAVIMGEQIINDFAPDYVIPFSVEKKKVMEAFKEFSKKPLTPKAFDCEKVVDKLQGVYIPFWLYSGNCDGDVDAECYNEQVSRKGDYKIIKRDFYSVKRHGCADFKFVPVDASSKTEDEAMDSIEPYDFKDFKPFNPAYLSGFLAERYDEDQEKCFPRAQERIENTTLDLIKETCNYDNIEVRKYDKKIKLEETKYAMMPAWLLYTTYKDKKYFFAMNGQTGKFVGSLPIDKGKLVLFSILGGILGSVIGAFIGG
ncbi:MAG: hypothetical protein K6C68_10245 [Ruminococcus sp.]|nr:hypothetical protein [Ruminococcus sp.]